MLVTIKPPFAERLNLFPKYQIDVYSNVNCYSIYRAPLFTVLFCVPPRGLRHGKWMFDCTLF